MNKPKLAVSSWLTACRLLLAPPAGMEIRHVISISSPGGAKSFYGTEARPPAGFRKHPARKLRLLFHDTEDDHVIARYGTHGLGGVRSEPGPQESHIKSIVRFAHLAIDGTVLIHCHAGISRSTAAAVIVSAVQMGDGYEQEAVDHVLDLTNGAGGPYNNNEPIRPNRRMVWLADNLLQRRGMLAQAWRNRFHALHDNESHLPELA